MTPLLALSGEELLDPLGAQILGRLLARRQPTAQPPHLAQLVHRAERRVTAPPQLGSVGVRVGRQRPHHQYPAHPATWSGHAVSFLWIGKESVADAQPRYADTVSKFTASCKQLPAEVGI